MNQAELDAGNILTYEHIRLVNRIMIIVATKFLHRATDHDNSKLEAPEAETFAEYGPKMRDITYDPNNPDSEYERYRKEMDKAIQHHYANNSHHPEYFENGVDGMDLLDLVEMFCDWIAATMRHADGDINRSIEINIERFKLSPQLVQILKNTVPLVEGVVRQK